MSVDRKNDLTAAEKDRVLKDYLRTIEEIEVFNRIGKTLTSTLETKVVLQKIMKHISNLFKPDRWSLMLVDDNSLELSYEIFVGKGSSKIKSNKLKVGDGIAGWVAKNGEPLFIPDASKLNIFAYFNLSLKISLATIAGKIASRIIINFVNRVIRNSAVKKITAPNPDINQLYFFRLLPVIVIFLLLSSLGSK